MGFFFLILFYFSSSIDFFFSLWHFFSLLSIHSVLAENSLVERTNNSVQSVNSRSKWSQASVWFGKLPVGTLEYMKHGVEIGEQGWAGDRPEDLSERRSSWLLSAVILSASHYCWIWLEFCGFFFVFTRVEDWYLIQKEREKNGWTDSSLGWCAHDHLAGIPTDRQVIVFLLCCACELGLFLVIFSKAQISKSHAPQIEPEKMLNL